MFRQTGHQATDTLQHVDSPGDLEATTLDETAVESARRLTLLINTLSLRFNAAVAAEGLGQLTSNNDIIVLGELLRHGPGRPGSLRDATGLTSGGLSLLLDRLESAGLITRSLGAIADDRRGVVVDLTRSGAAVISQIADTVDEVIAELDPLVEEFARLLELLPAPADQPSRIAVTAESPVELLLLLTQLGNEVIADLADENYDTDVSQARAAVVLCRAADPDGARPRDLVEVTGLSSSGVTQLLHEMEAVGLIKRAAGLLPDRRAVCVTLTPDGQRSLRTRLTRMARRSRPSRDVLTALRSRLEPSECGVVMPSSDRL